jgi:multidrug efflux pump subunit AcrB
MKNLIQWSIRNAPALNMLLVGLLVIGAISFVVIRREVFPNFRLEVLLVTVAFPGATAAEVEDGVCEVLESSISGTDKVKKMNSVAREGFAFLILELENSVKDVQPVLNDVRRRIDRVSNQLPPRAEKPELQQIVFKLPAITVGLTGPGDPDNQDLESLHMLRNIAEEVRTELLELRPVAYTWQEQLTSPRALLAPLYQPKGPAVTSAEIAAERPYEIGIEIQEDTLRQYRLSLKGFAQSIRQQNIDVPGGKMETAGQELLLRGNNKRDSGQEIAQLPAITKPNGDIVRIGDLAEVVDGFADTVSIHTINGKPGMTIQVSKTDQEDLFTVVDAVKRYVANKSLPPGYTISYWDDVSVDVNDRINMLYSNGVSGLILVFVLLAIFLDLRLAFWVALGIPVSILGAGIILLMTGQTLNMLTMFAFLMALGMVVDDAIVVGDNIYEKRMQGLGYVQAAIEGTYEVFPSVVASVLTTVIAYLPLMFVTGVMGKFISIMPIAVIAMLVISLIESAVLLPEHLSHKDNLFTRLLGNALYVFKPLLFLLTYVQRLATYLLDKFSNCLYAPVLDWSLHHKSIVVGMLSTVLITMAGMFAGGFIKFSFFPKTDAQEIVAVVAFPNGTSSEFAIQATRKLREAILRIEQEVCATGHPPIIEQIYEKIGETGDGALGAVGVTSGSHVGSIGVFLIPPEQRSISSQELNRRWREAVPRISGAEVLKFDSPGMGPGGVAIELKCLADSSQTELLDQFVDDCKAYLAEREGVMDIEDDSRPGKWEMNLRLNEQGQSLGMDESSLAETIRGVYFGEEVQRLQRGRHEVKVMVRYPKSERSSIEALGDVRVRDNSGQQRPLKEVAQISYGRQASEIKRMNQKRAITVSADVDPVKANAREIIKEMQTVFLPELMERYKQTHGVTITADWEGEQAQTAESINSMFIGFGIAMLAMYILLIFQFRSYIQAFIIMAIIPFAWVGALSGHYVVGIDVTLFSFFGLVALTGVVVNDSIVLIDTINRMVREGTPLYEVLHVAGKRRLRPIMLTSLTTIAGLLPILFEKSQQAQVIIPMAVSIAFGLMVSTFLCLVMVPVLYQIYGIVLSWLGYPLFEAEDLDGGNGGSQSEHSPVPDQPLSKRIHPNASRLDQSENGNGSPASTFGERASEPEETLV